MARFDAAQVKGYYERHTPAFVGLGQGRDEGAIHRAVWGPGVSDSAAAFHYVDELIVQFASRLPVSDRPLHVVDLGCGVGASLCYLAGRLPMRGTGVTLSPLQARLAAEGIRRAGLAERVACIEADYTDLPAGLGPADVAYAIESFVHAQSPQRFFDQCRRLLRPGGLLIICDDFRGSSAGGAAAERAVHEFCTGWHVNALLRPEDLRAAAGQAGFEHESTLDLSPYLHIHRLRDRAISAFLTMLQWLPAARARFDDLYGGRALQTCLRRGWIVYQIAVFRRAQ